jgi:hypothetical protein
VGQLIDGKVAHFTTGSATPATHFEDTGELIERESNGQRVAHHTQVVNRIATVFAVPVSRPSGLWQNSHPLVVPQRVSAYTRQLCKLTGA